MDVMRQKLCSQVPGYAHPLTASASASLTITACLMHCLCCNVSDFFIGYVERDLWLTLEAGADFDGKTAGLIIGWHWHL